jgi:hypothetical protein
LARTPMAWTATEAAPTRLGLSGGETEGYVDGCRDRVAASGERVGRSGHRAEVKRERPGATGDHAGEMAT